jgi:hypothetical protein
MARWSEDEFVLVSEMTGWLERAGDDRGDGLLLAGRVAVTEDTRVVAEMSRSGSTPWRLSNVRSARSILKRLLRNQ